MLLNRTASSLDEVSSRFLRIILPSVEHAGDLVDDLLAFSPMSRVELRSTLLDINRLVGKALDEMRLESAGRNNYPRCAVTRQCCKSSSGIYCPTLSSTHDHEIRP
jgi:hypothetical protein